MELRTMGDVRLAANDCGMTVEQYFAESAPEELERVDWNDERPSDGYLGERLQILDEQLEQLERERLKTKRKPIYWRTTSIVRVTMKSSPRISRILM